jgi:6-phosphogluconolactonase/glucosamine-6-phosphate isomerase/deaminase
MPSVKVLQQKKIAEAVSRDAMSLLEGEEHPVIAVSGGQIAPLCLARILDKVSPERTITVVLTDERYGVDVSAQNAVQLRSITSTSGKSGKLSFLAPSTSKPPDQSLRDFQVLLSSIATPVLALLGVGVDGHVASIFPSQSSVNFQNESP